MQEYAMLIAKGHTFVRMTTAFIRNITGCKITPNLTKTVNVRRVVIAGNTFHVQCEGILVMGKPELKFSTVVSISALSILRHPAKV